MASYIRSPFGVAKRLKTCSRVAPQHRNHATYRSPFLEMLKDDFDNVDEAAQTAGHLLPTASAPAYDPLDPSQPRLPRNVAALYLRPLRRTPTHGLPVCDLQLRSFSTRQLTLAADFALRAAYYLGLPAKGPVPLPRRTERWTVPRSNFVHKKSQENFERVTVRRLVQIQDGDSEVVRAWLGFLMKYPVSGVGMKANVWEHEGMGEQKGNDKVMKEIEEGMNGRWELFGRLGKGVAPGLAARESADEAVVEALGKQLAGLQTQSASGENTEAAQASERSSARATEPAEPPVETQATNLPATEGSRTKAPSMNISAEPTGEKSDAHSKPAIR